VSFQIRPITPEEFAPFAKANAAGFSNDFWLPHLDGPPSYFECDRSLGVLDGEEFVGTTSIFSFDTTVPGGGALPTAGVTWVSVRPTHRRQGILGQMMRRQLNDVRERGEPIATLWASESIIYGRFGYGLAADTLDLEIERVRTAFGHEPPSSGRVRMIERDQALASWPAVYDAVRAKHPGFHSRSEDWWKDRTLPEKDRQGGGGFSGRFFVQYEEEGRPLGYARYRVRNAGENGLANGTLAIQELMAATDGAYAAIWRYLFGVDLVGTVQARLRRSDEPLRYMLADPRRLIRRPADSLWVRIVDPVVSLEARRYAGEGRVVFDVRDTFCPWVEGRYELEGGPDGATCRTTTAEPDISLSAADLGAAYLGGTRFATLSRAGRVEGDPKAIQRADAMFAWDPAPWCPEVF
jgi:predicted acetyltransferase